MLSVLKLVNYVFIKQSVDILQLILNNAEYVFREYVV